MSQIGAPQGVEGGSVGEGEVADQQGYSGMLIFIFLLLQVRGGEEGWFCG